MAKKAAGGCPVPSGVLLIIGGKENKGEIKNERKMPEDFVEMEVLKTFVDLLHKKMPVIEVITTAGSEGAESFQEYKKAFHELGVEQVNHIHHNSRREVLEEDLSERVKNADGIFFSGGDQLKLTSVYGGTSFLTLLKDRYIHNGLVVGGTSAGAMALSTPMIYAGTHDVEQIAGEIKITTGLEFLKDVCIDTHFVDRGRFIRMAQVIVTNPTCIGIGIEEDTALVVRHGLEAEVVGSGSVIVIDGFHIGDSNVLSFSDKNNISIRDLKVHILGKGDHYAIPQCNPPHI